MNRLANWLQQRANHQPHDTALVHDGGAMTFTDLALRAAACEGDLDGRGLGRNAVVATLMQSGPTMVTLAHAVPSGGRILAPLGARLAAAELSDMLDRCAAAALVYDEATAPLADQLRPRQPLLRIRAEDLPAAPDRAVTAIGQRRIDLRRTHTILFTSGSSGAPKAVRLTWGNHLWSALATTLHLGLRRDDRWLCCLPLNHVGGLSILMRSAVSGHAVDLHRRFDPSAANAAIDDGATIVSVVANMLRRMLDERGGRPYPPTLRAVLVGGGPLPQALLVRCRRAGVAVLPTYGLTETASQVATAAVGDSGDGRCRPLPFVEVRIAGTNGKVLPAGRAGEIQVRGPMVSPGEVDEPARRPDAWLATRDSGWLDEAGRLHVLGRADETVISGGENVHPGEIETVLERHPAVLEAFATGVDDARWSQVIHAAVRVARPVGERELLDHCRAQLAGFKIPRRIRIISEFPRTPAGKIARAAVAAAVRRQSAARHDND